jgi:hypothetical protein
VAAVPPPVPFPAFNTIVLPANQSLVRVHQPVFDGRAPNPCKGGLTRFAPIYDAAGDCIPTLYAGDSFRCAVYESIFHDVPYAAGDKFVRMGKVSALAVSWLSTSVPLKVAPLNEPDLSKLGRTRADVIATDADQYPITAKWAEALYAADPDLAGLAWTSRRSDPDQAFLFFGDRLPAGALVVEDRAELATAGDRVADIAAFGRRAGITLSL